MLTLAPPGCTFACTYCQNFRLSQFGRRADALWTADLCTPDAILATAHTHSVAAIGFSYSEPILAAEQTLAIAPRAERALGDPARTTLCARCSTTLVEREPWSLRAIHLVDGRCPRCQTPPPGVWSPARLDPSA